MAGRAGRRRYGTVRLLASGRFQASFVGPDGQRRNAPETFATKGDAGRWLTMTESAMLRGTWTDPERGKVSLQEYGQRWIEQRPGLRPRTVDLYRWLFGRYLRSQLGRSRLLDLDPQQVRQWRHELLSDGVSEGMTAKAYRLLRAVLNTAVEDGLIAKNPCQIKGGGTESPAERPTISVSQVLDLADRMPDQYRMLVLLAVFGSLRWGEVTALRRSDVDIERGTVTVRGARCTERTLHRRDDPGTAQIRRRNTDRVTARAGRRAAARAPDHTCGSRRACLDLQRGRRPAAAT